MAAMPTNVIMGGVYFVQLKPDNQYGTNLTANSIIILHACLQYKLLKTDMFISYFI